MATGRLSDLCTALYTVAMPPAPISAIISYSSFIFFGIALTDSLPGWNAFPLSDVLHSYHNHGNIVHSSVIVGPAYEVLCRGRRRFTAKNPCDLFILDHFRQAVGAEEENIALFELEHAKIRMDFRMNAN